MQLEEYKNVMRTRYDALPDEEKTLIGELSQMPVGDVLYKVLGPELTGVASGQEETPQEQPPQEQPPQEQTQPRRMGLGSR